MLLVLLVEPGQSLLNDNADWVLTDAIDQIGSSEYLMDRLRKLLAWNRDDLYPSQCAILTRALRISRR